MTAKDEAKLRESYPLIDLTPITRKADRSRTRIFITVPHLGGGSSKIEWIRTGLISMSQRERREGWELISYLQEGATDVEHDSAYALTMSLFDVHFDSVDYNKTVILARVDMDEDPQFGRTFRVPPPGYNPLTHPEASMCEGKKYCKQGKPHIIVPHGHYCPKFDPALYKRVAGKKLEIHISPVYEKEEEEI